MRKVWKHIRIGLRLLRLGLLHRYIIWKVRYGGAEARRRLLLAGYEYRLHRLLRRLGERYGDLLIIDIGAPPYEKARYARWYIGVDLSHDDRIIYGPEVVQLVEADVASPSGVSVVERVVRSARGRYRPGLSVATIDVEGNASEDLIDRLLRYVDLVVIEVHPGSQEEIFLGRGRVLDSFPDGTKHILIFSPFSAKYLKELLRKPCR